MARRYSEPVEVRAVRPDPGQADGEAPAGDLVPASFLWRGRLYVVREVLGHWRERRAWWTAAAARAVHGEGEGGTGGGDPAFLSPAASCPLGEEDEVWRVEASPGRNFGLGVYDLRHDLSAGSVSASTPGGWRMHRVTD